MRVYFENMDEYFQDKKNIINSDFKYKDIEFKLLDLYEFPIGIVLDIIAILDYNTLQKYYEEYVLREKQLTAQEINHANRINPKPSLQIKAILCDNDIISDEIMQENGVYVDGYSTFIKESIPIQLKKEYEFLQKKNTAFFYCRCHASFKDINKKASLFDGELITFRVENQPHFYEINKQFTLDTKAAYAFKHPAANIIHKLRLDDIAKINDNLSAFIFTISPGLPQEQSLIIEQICEFKGKSQPLVNIGFGQNYLSTEYVVVNIYNAPDNINSIKLNIIGIESTVTNCEDIAVLI